MKVVYVFEGGLSTIKLIILYIAYLLLNGIYKSRHTSFIPPSAKEWTEPLSPPRPPAAKITWVRSVERKQISSKLSSCKERGEL